MPADKKKLTKQEELLLKDFSRNLSKKSSVVFYGNAFLIAAIPIWLFWRIHQMDPTENENIAAYALTTVFATWLIAYGYRNTKFVMKHKAAQLREEGVSREMQKKLADDKKMSRDEKEERVLWKRNEVADYEATTFSIFYNNAIFISILIIISFGILRSANPLMNYLVSMGISAGLCALFSTGSGGNKK